jgi:hypothetical protein
MQHENRERTNNTKFQTGVISSSNRAVTDVLLAMKSFPDGEMKRILEIHVEQEEGRDGTWSRAHFERLMNNYGHAAEPYFKAVLAQLPAVKDLLEKTRDRVDAAAKIRPSERYWSLIVALAVTGGLIAKKLGLHDIPVQPVFDFGIDLIKKTRIKSREYLADGDEFLGVFMGRHFNEILVINSKPDKRTGLDYGPIKEPRNALTMRYEPDVKILYVSVDSYRQEINKTSMNFEETLKPYLDSKALILHAGGKMTQRKRLFTGTSADAKTQTTCLWFDTTKLEFFDEKLLLRPDDENTEPVSTG